MSNHLHEAPRVEQKSGPGSPVGTTMRYEITKRPGVTEVALKGSMCFSDHNAFREIMEAFNVPAGHQMVFNLSNLEYVDSSGLGMFLIADEEAKKKSIRFRLEFPRNDVRRVINLGKLDRIIDIRQ